MRPSSMIYRPRVVTAILFALAGFILWAVFAQNFTQNPGLHLLIAALAGTLATAVLAMTLVGVWSPLGAPLLYMGVVMFAPPLYVMATGKPIFLLTPLSVSERVSIVGVVALAAYAIGAAVLGFFCAKDPVKERARGFEKEAARNLNKLAVTLLIFSCSARIYAIYGTWGQAYGEDQLSASLPVRMGQWSIIAAIVGTSLLVLSQVRLYNRLSSRTGYFLIILSCVLALANGGRFQVLVVVIFFLMFKYRYFGFKKPWLVIAGGLTMMVLFSYIGTSRTGMTSPDLTLLALIESTLTDFSSVYLTISMTVESVGMSGEFAGGSSYLAAVPGIAELLGMLGTGSPPEPGAMAFRRLIGMNNPNLGLGFSLPAEAYLNFGYAGVVGIFLAIGGGLARLYKKFVGSSDVVSGFSFALLVSALPYTFRSDAVSLVNLWMYPIIFILLAKCLSVRSDRVAPTPRATILR